MLNKKKSPAWCCTISKRLKQPEAMRTGNSVAQVRGNALLALGKNVIGFGEERIIGLGKESVVDHREEFTTCFWEEKHIDWSWRCKH